MAKIKQVEQVQPGAVLMSWRDGVRLLIAGALIGILTMALYLLLEKYLFTPALCGELNAGNGKCENTGYFASGVALIFSGLAALFFLVQQRVYRPLLVVILVGAALWNVPVLLASLPLLGAIIFSVVLFTLAYGAFAWIVQLKNFFVALVFSLLIVALTRFVLLS